MTPKEKKIIQKALEGIVQTALGGPSGEPDDAHLMCAAQAYQTMKKLKLDLGNVEDVEEDDGVMEMIDVVRYDGSYRPE